MTAVNLRIPTFPLVPWDVWGAALQEDLLALKDAADPAVGLDSSVAALVGGTGETEAALDGRYGRARAAGNRVAFLGDSITAGGWQNSSNLQSTSYPLYAMLTSSGRVLVAANAGKSGDTSTQALARFDTEVTPFAPNIVVTLLGTNDVGQSVPLGTFQSNIEAIVAKTRSIGAAPVLGMIPPNNATARHASINTWNAWLRRYAAGEGIPVIDFYATLADPANGNFSAAYVTDGTHPNEAGYLAMGIAASVVLSAITAASKPYMSQDNADAINAVTATNSVMLTDAGGDGVPDGWFAYGGSSGYAHSLITQSGVPGKMARITQTANGSIRAMQRSVAGVSVGDRIAISGVVSNDGGIVAQVKTSFAGAGTNGQAVNFKAAVTAGTFYQELTVPTGTTSATLDLIAGAGTGVVAWGQVTVINLTTLGV